MIQSEWMVAALNWLLCDSWHFNKLNFTKFLRELQKILLYRQNIFEAIEKNQTKECAKNLQIIIPLSLIIWIHLDINFSVVQEKSIKG